MSRFAREILDQDRMFGVAVDDQHARISGLQGSNLPIIKNLGRFLSGEAIFQRMMDEQGQSGQVQVAEDMAATLAIRSDVRVRADEGLTA